MFVLSYLINENNRITNEEFARKGFYKKYEAIENEFLRIENYQSVLKRIVKKSNPKELQDNLTILNEISYQDRLIHNNWFVTDEVISDQVVKEHTSTILNQRIPTTNSEQFYPNQPPLNSLINYQDSMYWVSYDSIQVNGFPLLWFGYTINLMDLHQYFTTIDTSATNYAYVFNKDGVCINHPDQNYIGENVFEFTDLSPRDTVKIKNKDYTQKSALSEYLQLDVTRFVKPLKTKNFEGYVAVNYVNLLMDESVQSVKKYTTLIFLIAIFLIVFVFLFFNHARKKAYEEKEIVSKERNNLLIENEKIHKEQALNQLKQLKEQINPHFLFNSLNSLYMLIDINAVTAKKFTLNLSKIYRYLIHPPQGNTVPLANELAFIHEYISLQGNRFSEELIFTVINAIPESSNKLLPYLALQIVVENAMKHNVATIENPLKIEIRIHSDCVVVKNNLQPKTEDIEKENFGLKYLEKIYHFHQCYAFTTQIKNDEFICVLPLI